MAFASSFFGSKESITVRSGSGTFVISGSALYSQPNIVISVCFWLFRLDAA
jgi:hypothetical protein